MSGGEPDSTPLRRAQDVVESQRDTKVNLKVTLWSLTKIVTFGFFYYFFLYWLPPANILFPIYEFLPMHVHAVIVQVEVCFPVVSTDC